MSRRRPDVIIGGVDPDMPASLHPREDPQEPSAGGGLNADMARAVVAVHRRHLGRGPTRARAFFHDNVIVVLLEDVLTKLEASLLAASSDELVDAVRRQTQVAMRADLVAAVEGLTGRGVTACLSAFQARPDVASELFVLERPVASRPSTRRDPSPRPQQLSPATPPQEAADEA